MDEANIPEVRSLLVFTSDEVELIPGESPIPAMKLKQLKEFLRQQSKNRTLSSKQISDITDLFAKE